MFFAARVYEENYRLSTGFGNWLFFGGGPPLFCSGRGRRRKSELGKVPETFARPNTA